MAKAIAVLPKGVEGDRQLSLGPPFNEKRRAARAATFPAITEINRTSGWLPTVIPW
jgi:hypothetical protein